MLKRHCNVENGDRISSLPESIICHILSFLPTKYAVRTSTLSTRWKSLWTSVTTLDFDDRIMGFHGTKYHLRLANDFMNSVERVLFLRGVHSTIKKFRLRLANAKYDAFRVTSWICATTKQNVEELSLDMKQGLDFELPLSLLNCEKLMVLKLSGKISLDNINFSVCLKHLRVLHFLHLQNLHDAGVSKLIDGSPVLEELVIKRAGKNSAESLHLQSPSLKRLTISYEGDVESIVVDAPQLEFIKLSENTPKVLKMIQSSSLVEADIQVGWSGMRKEVQDDYFDAAAQLLRQMSNIEILHFSIPQQLEKPFNIFSSIKLRTFHNLIRLELRGSVLGTGVLPLMLKGSPKLKVIILREMYSLKSTCVSALGEDVLCMWYMSCCLEVAELKGFTGREAQMEIVKFLLKIAKRLKKMVISFYYSYSSNSKLPAALNELLSFPGASGIFQLPWSPLQCDKLVVMKLSSEFSLGRHSFHNVLETLEVFHLHQVQNIHAAAVTKILNGSQVLEELVIKGAGFDSVKNS